MYNIKLIFKDNLFTMFRYFRISRPLPTPGAIPFPPVPHPTSPPTAHSTRTQRCDTLASPVTDGMIFTTIDLPNL